VHRHHGALRSRDVRGWMPNRWRGLTKRSAAPCFRDRNNAHTVVARESNGERASECGARGLGPHS